MPKRSFQKISNRYGTDTVLFLARLEPHEISVIQLDLSSVLNEQNAFVIGNEFGENSERSGLSRAGTAANEDVLSGEDVIFEAVGEGLIQRPCLC